ncbi:GDSL-type esterase/lipase family protein [Rubripirellula amarantea]|uniref:GDSL-like Lipase/Acylhydrolase n=1 Tax=Rubripirellula amarantea TaxID=2527999 RepID=A0A5C5WU50_9BACT|nr:GDSL-type esterase/lipase family protein [Rubripirellula amarantea]MDA8744260.1 GDSL-type esterase/lipase family protein [Rubripirellula amarantea]TWT54216.1 GDSL-like Lipase/Acylhydrolase [Rubripirellula amarantea]
MLRAAIGYSLVLALLVLGKPLVGQEATLAPLTFEIPATDEGLAGTGPIRRYDWMKNIWNERRTTFAKNAAESTGAIVFLGDSITQGWADDFRDDFSPITENGFKVANRGISGDTTRGMLLRLEDDVLSLKPTAVVMLMGTNDLDEGATPESTVGNIGLILERMNEHNSEMPIVLCLVMPSSETKNRPAEKIKQINEGLRDLVRGNDQVTIVDTWTLFADENGDAKEAEFPDLLHPNGIGYAKWRAALLPIFATLGFTDLVADDFEVEPGFVSLFNGKDLTGWQFRPTPEPMRKGRARWLGSNPKGVTWPLVESVTHFDGSTQSPNGRFVAMPGRIVVTTPSSGRVIEQLWTKQEFDGDFTLRLEFRASVNSDSGVFIRMPQLQVRDYSLAGPYKNLKRYQPQQWNELEITVKDDVAHCTCNGEVLEQALPLPAKGPIGLEGDRGQVEYRRIRIRLPNELN